MAQVGTTESVSTGAPLPSGGEVTAAVIGRSPGELFWRRFRKDKFAIGGVVVIVLIVALAILAPYIERDVAHHEKNAVNLLALDEFGLPSGPSGQYWFGVDTAGRDLFVRVIYGARTSLTIAVVATGISVVIGVVLGLLSGFYRGKVDTFISRLTDVVLSLPVLLLALGLVSACGLTKDGCLYGLLSPGLTLVSIVIGLFSWPYISRIVRGQVLSLREKEFVEASRSLGASNWRIVFREILPNVAAPIIAWNTR
jgi:peptide/nickel transport system permease protein